MNLHNAVKDLSQNNSTYFSNRPEKFLLLCFYDPKQIPRVSEAVTAIQQSSIFSISILNLFEHGYKGSVSLHPKLNLEEFDGLIIHNTVSNDAGYFKSLDIHLTTKIKFYNGVKILLKQDENFECSEIASYISDTGFDLVYPCLPEEGFDEQAVSLLESKSKLKKPIVLGKQELINILLLVEHDPILDPRLEWIVQHTTPEIQIVQLGKTSNNEGILIAGKDNSFEKRILNKTRWYKGIFTKLWPQILGDESGFMALNNLFYLEYILSLPEKEFCDLLGAPYGHARNKSFRDLLVYILNISAVLLDQSSSIFGIHAIIACDLPTLSAGLVLKGIWGIPIIYDAHEYWADCNSGGLEYEKSFWINMERKLVQNVDYCQTVSTGLAKFMSNEYNVKFESAPNCVPLDNVPNLPEKESSLNTCRFLFQGGLAPNRGLDILIEIWPLTDERAILIIRGMDGKYKEHLEKLASNTGLLGSRILFLPAVSESELVSALVDGDVGLIPYVPICNNNKYCCPNKLSQYMAAKLPILANKTEFIQEIVETANAGLIVDFSQPKIVIDAVFQFVNDRDAREQMGLNGYKYLLDSFHWEKCSQNFYNKLVQLTAGKDKSRLSIYYEYHSKKPWFYLILKEYSINFYRFIIPAKIRGILSPYARMLLGISLLGHKFR